MAHRESSNTWGNRYTQVPNTILKARNLDSDSKVALALLISTYTYARDNQQLLEDDQSFYFTTTRFSEEMSISGDQVLRKVIPDLEQRGLITKTKRIDKGKTHNYYALNIEAINKYDGTTLDLDSTAKKSARGKKAYQGRAKKEAAIRAKWIDQAGRIVREPLTIVGRETAIASLAERLSKEEGYKPSVAQTLVKQMIEEAQKREQEAERKRLLFMMSDFDPEWLEDEDEDEEEEEEEEEEEDLTIKLYTLYHFIFMISFNP
jgi:hypothetical protein